MGKNRMGGGGGRSANGDPKDAPAQARRAARLAAALALALGSAQAGEAFAEAPDKATRVVVSKSEGTLYAFAGDRLLLSAPAATGADRSGPKARRGDMRTPEGVYPLDYKKSASAFRKSIHVGYPTPGQAAAALAAGIDPGDEILVHGPRLSADGPSEPLEATEGCVALSAEDMDALWDIVDPGIPIVILP